VSQKPPTLETKKSPLSIEPPPELQDKGKSELQGLAFSLADPTEPVIKPTHGGKREGSGRKKKGGVPSPEPTEEHNQKVDAFLGVDILYSAHVWVLTEVAHSRWVNNKDWQIPQEPVRGLALLLNGIAKKRIPDSVLENGEELAYLGGLVAIVASMYLTRKKENAEQDSRGIRKEGKRENAVHQEEAPTSV